MKREHKYKDLGDRLKKFEKFQECYKTEKDNENNNFFGEISKKVGNKKKCIYFVEMRDFIKNDFRFTAICDYDRYINEDDQTPA